MNAQQLPITFNADKIQQELTQFTKADYYDIYNPSVTLETLWSKHFIEPIGGPDQAPTFVPNKALRQCPYLLSIYESFKCPIETFRIHTLDARASIKPHRDIGYSLAHGKIRIHIPIVTNDRVQLLLNNEPVHMKAGECWYCNFHITHEVHNYSDQPRTHLIMDCLVNDWLLNLFKNIDVLN